MSDEGRPVIPRALRPSECPMPLPVTDRSATVTPDPSLLAAATDVAEADPPQTVAADPAIIDTELHRSYRDVVADEHIRQSRLSRWQEQR